MVRTFRLLVKRAWIASLVPAALYASQSPSEGRCTPIPAHDPEASVVVCETDTHYVFKIGDGMESHEKVAYQTALVDSVKTWLTTTGSSNSLLNNVEVRVWLSVPEVNPNAAKVRAMFIGPRAKFVVSLPISPAEWRVGSAAVGILTDRLYPDSYGYRAGSLLLEKRADADEPQFLKAVAPYIQGAPERFSGEWYAADVKVFQEANAQTKITHLTKEVTAHASFNQMVEWMAWRAEVFAFRTESAP